LHIDLLNDATAFLEFREDSSIFVGGRLFEGPTNQLRQARPRGCPRGVATAARLQPSDDLAQHWKADADFRALAPGGGDANIDTLTFE
jgi:hypothetical protein